MNRVSGTAPLFHALADAAAALWPLVVLARFAASVVRPQVGLFGLDLALACVLVAVVLVLAAASFSKGAGG